MSVPLNENELMRVVTDTAIEVQREHGSGRSGEDEAESFRALLTAYLGMRGLSTEARRIAPGTYNGVKITRPQTVPLIVGGLLVVDVLAVAKIEPVHEAGTLSRLRLAGLTSGLIVNFGQHKIRDGIRRVLDR
jgi:GxxExxY protein